MINLDGLQPQPAATIRAGAQCRRLCRFLDAGMTTVPSAVAAGVQKAPRHEVAGSLALMVQRGLWGFDSGAGLEGGCNTDRMRPADWRTGEIGSV